MLQGIFFTKLFYNEGLRTIPAATSSIIMALTPMTTALMATIIYKDTIRPIGWLFTITAFIGVAIIILWEFRPYYSCRSLVDFVRDDTLCSV